MATITDTQVPAPGRCYLDPDATTVRFATRHLFGLAPIRGTMPVLSGAVHVGDPIGTSLVQAELDPAGFATGNQQRDTTVRNPRYLDSDAHPRAGRALPARERARPHRPGLSAPTEAELGRPNIEAWRWRTPTSTPTG